MIKIISRKSDLAIIQACLVGDAIKDRKSDINDKRDIIKPSFKLNGLRIFEWKFSTDPKRIKVLIIKVVPPNMLKVNFEILDLFFNDS